MNSWTDPLISPDRKRCPDCGETKPLEQFCRNKSSRDGHAAYCKPCHNARTRETVRRLYRTSRHYHLKQKYGIGADEAAALIAAQGGMCAICRRKAATQIDHDHLQGRACRAALCDGCNGLLSAFRENDTFLKEAIEYLKAWKEQG